MERVQLEVGRRAELGKERARRLRASGSIPAVLYGARTESTPLVVDGRALEAVLRRGSNQIIDLRGLDGGDEHLVLLKELQRDPVTQRVLHCDFYQVDTSKRVEVSIPVHIEGRAIGVEKGGVLDVLMREVAVSCLPLIIPENVSVDVSALDIGDAVHASDLRIPEGVELLESAEAPVVHVVAPRVEEEPVEAEEAEAAAEAPAEGAEPGEGAAPAADENAGE